MCKQVGEGGLASGSGCWEGHWFSKHRDHRPKGGGGPEQSRYCRRVNGHHRWDKGEDQGLDGGDGRHVVRQVSQKQLCVKEESFSKIHKLTERLDLTQPCL